jgi:hypothetical protein
MIESGEVKKYYQWKSGFRSGQVECYLAETEDMIFFESGTSVSKGRIDEDLHQINEEIYFQKSKTAQSQRTIEEEFSKLIGETPNQPLPVETASPSPQIKTVEKSPIQIILERQKKKETRKISIEIDVDVPSEKVIDLLTTMFDEDEVYEEIVSSSIKLDTDQIKKLIQDSIIKQLRGLTDE